MIHIYTCAIITFTLVYGHMLQNKEIVLSFDDGPNKITSPLLLKTLETENVQAIFFHVGANLKDNPNILNLFRETNQFVGIHTFSHARLSRISHNQMVKEIEDSFSIFENQISLSAKH